MTPTLLVALAGLLPAAQDAKADALKTEMKKFEGTWKTASLVQDGEEVPGDQFEGMTLLVEGDKRILKMGDEVRSKATYKLDPSASPKTIDISVEEGPLKGQTVYGIYEIDADTMKICLNLQGKERPKKLESASGSGFLLQIFKRDKK